MMDTVTQFSSKAITRKALDIRPGDTVRVHQKIKEGDKTRSQVFEGVVIARRHGSGINATITVRKISFGVGVERIFPIHSPTIEKIEVVKRAKVRRAKLYYLRSLRGRKARMKAKQFEAIVYEDAPAEQERDEPKEEEAQGEEDKGESETRAESAGRNKEEEKDDKDKKIREAEAE